MSALHIAALEGHRGLVEALLAAGALPLPPAATVPRVYAALPLSPATCHVVACCHALVGATRTLCDSSGATAAELASSMGHAEIAALLGGTPAAAHGKKRAKRPHPESGTAAASRRKR